MGKRGKPLEYDAKLEVRISTELLAKLDKLRGDKGRSEFIRALIRKEEQN